MQSDSKKTYRIMISGGGTGGHIYPAISIAQALEKVLSSVQILFVGAKGRMEMNQVPLAGYKIYGIWISGIQRKFTLKNLILPLKLLISLIGVYRLIRSFKPDVVVGTGGYVSGPLLFMASLKRIPTLIQEQNSYAGLTNKILGSRVSTICVPYEGMGKYFPQKKIVVTGNPVRNRIYADPKQRDEAFKYFGLDVSKAVVLVLGGSLGARRINEQLLEGINLIKENDIQVLWQCGSQYYEKIIEKIDFSDTRIFIHPFIDKMNFAYEVASVVVARAGALSIAELAINRKPSVLVPSPYLAEDHQTKNAMKLKENEAAILIPESEIDTLLKCAISLTFDDEKKENLSSNISKMAYPNADVDIANEVIKLMT